MCAGYAMLGMKGFFHSNFKIKMIKISSITVIKKQNKCIYIFSLIIIKHVILEAIIKTLL